MDLANTLRAFEEMPRVTLFITTPMLLISCQIMLTVANSCIDMLSKNGCKTLPFFVGVIGGLSALVFSGILAGTALIISCAACRGTNSAIGPAYFMGLLVSISWIYWRIRKVLADQNKAT